MSAIFDHLPPLNDITEGSAAFREDTPIWLAKFGDDIWPFTSPESPLYRGDTSSSFVWRDYVNGHGTAFGHPNSLTQAKYKYCLTDQIVQDLKIAAVIHGYYPRLLKHAKNTNDQIDPKTVKGRIEELVRFFSFIRSYYHNQSGVNINRLDEIPFSLLKECISRYTGRGSHLKRALKLISDPMVQKNLSAHLQWQLLDITSKSIRWPADNDEGGIPTLTDAQFVFLINYCRKRIHEFKCAVGLELHDRDIDGTISTSPKNFAMALDAYYEHACKDKRPDAQVFKNRFGCTLGEVSALLIDAHCSALMVILLLTGMRDSEAKFLMRGCLANLHGYWFLSSKVVKGKPKDTPICEGWLATELTHEAYDILQFVCQKTGNPYLMSSANVTHSTKNHNCYRGGALNTKLQRWIKRIDHQGLFSDWSFSVHQCRESLVYQLARQEVGMPFISMQLKHFQNKFNRMPNAVTAGYGEYRSQLLSGIAKRKAQAREHALQEVYGENAAFAGGGATAHKARIDTFFSGLGLFGKDREEYIRKMANRGVKLMPTSIGNCTKNFIINKEGELPPPCYGDYQCDPDCQNHVMTPSAAAALEARSCLAKNAAANETNQDYRKLWLGLAEKLDRHICKLNQTSGRETS